MLQVCEAGLHISLGNGLRLFNLLEKSARNLTISSSYITSARATLQYKRKSWGSLARHTVSIFPMIWYKFLESMTASHHFPFYEGLEDVDAMGKTSHSTRPFTTGC